jgi:ribonuclease BN (tRNA processing enzyme)
MRLTFLGTGSAMPTGERFQTGYLLQHEDDALLVDCGSGVLHALPHTAVGYEGVDTVLFTHHHLDHVSDLLPLLKARWLAGEETLTVVGPAGTPDLVRDLLSVHDYMEGRMDLTLREIGATDGPGGGGGDSTGDAHEVAGFDVRAMETRHSMYCLAYRLSPAGGEGPTITLSGDSEAFPDLCAFADGSAVLSHDCSFPDEVDVDNHPTPTSLGEALAVADPDLGRVYLSHLYPHTNGEHESMLDSIGEHYDGDVRFAKDGLTVDVTSVE